MGKSVIREILNEISRPDDPPLTPPKRGIEKSPLGRGYVGVGKVALIGVFVLIQHNFE